MNGSISQKIRKNSTIAMMSVTMLSLMQFALCSEKETLTSVQLSSPDKRYQYTLSIDQDSLPSYRVDFQDQEIIGRSDLGHQFASNSGENASYSIERVDTTETRNTWKPVYGEKNEYPDQYNEAFIKLQGASYDLRVRAYNEGVAFRYEFKDSLASNTIETELTEFSLPPDATAWASIRAQSEITSTPVSAIDTVVERPLLVQLQDSLFTAIGEAALVDYARMKLRRKTGQSGILTAALSGPVTLNDSVNQTPWRFVMAGNQPGELVENNYLLLNLNEPNQIDDTSFIRPGKVLREITLGTDAGLRCVDFAVEHNLQYVEFDAGWYGNEYDKASDATTVTVDPKRSTEKLDLQKVIDYAQSKNIGIILYVNRIALERQLNEVLPLLRKWGVSGVKYGFVDVGPQEATVWLHEAVRKAAEHELMVDIHDEYRPTGYARTYPNLMTVEGIRGDEESPKNSMVINTVFTRMIAGAGDHTNCYFAPRVTEIMGSHASQLAKAVCIYSPWQFLYWYDRPKGVKLNVGGAGGSHQYIEEVPELAWYDALPTVWDDTKVLSGYPGEHAVIARKSGTDWFIGALSGEQEREVSISLDFLDESTVYEATIYTDDPAVESLTKVAIENRKVRSKDTIQHRLLPNNGMAVHIRTL